MTQFVAFLGGQNSGVTTRDKAIEWASKQLANNHGHKEVFIGEIVAVVERTTPPISVFIRPR